MNAIKKPSGNIHRIREFELEKVSLAEEFDILQIVGEGWFGKILLVEHRSTDAEMVLKALPKPYVSLSDFYREFHYGLHLGTHKNIVTTFDVAFETAGFYVFTQEYAPLGDLTSNVADSGIGELHTKRVAKQIAAALDYMHTKDIVHRDIKLDNVLVFRSDFSRVKLCDFGESRRNGTLVQRRNEWLPYSPPEVLTIRTDDTYKTELSHDVWQFGILVFVCLTGCLPWQKAASDDPRYVRYLVWHNSTFSSIPIRRSPKLFKLASNRACKMFRKFLEPRQERRPKTLTDLSKFMEDRWLSKGAEKDMIDMEPDELCPSMYSFHSNPEEKNRIFSALVEAGIETTYDRKAKKARIRDWIQSSVIQEEDEEEEEEFGRQSPSALIHHRTPVAGHVSSVRAEEEREKEIKTSLKDASKKHYDPRTGLEVQGPNEMGSVSQNTQIIDKTNKDRNEVYKNGNGVYPHNGNNLPTQNAYSISQQYSSSKMSESGEQTLINARLDFPIHETITHQPAEVRPPRRDPKTKVKSAEKSKSFNNKYIRNKDHATQGLMSTFNSIAAIAMPESQQYHLNNQKLHNNYNPIKDSGYGSHDPLIKMPSDSNIQHQQLSPVLVKRSSIKLSNSGSLNVNNSSSSKDPSPFDSDDHDHGSLRGSSGFVNLVGKSAVSSTMKDSPYDRVKNGKYKK